MSALMLNSKPLRVKKPPKNSFRLLMFHLAESRPFDVFIVCCIIANCIILALRWYEQTKDTIYIVETLNLVFTVIFVIEAFVKICGYGKKYFKERWNQFDFCIVVVSVLEVIITQFVEVKVLVVITIFRIFRIGRLLRLAKSAKGIRVIVTAFVLTFPSVANIGGLLFLFVYIYSILGMQLFAKVQI
jgi:hypothetical protein